MIKFSIFCDFVVNEKVEREGSLLERHSVVEDSVPLYVETRI